MKKTLMIAAAALALTAGAASLTATPAQAGKFNIDIHLGGYGHGHYGHGHFYGGCFTKYKKVKIKVWGPYGWHWKWIKKPYTYCY